MKRSLAPRISGFAFAATALFVVSNAAFAATCDRTCLLDQATQFNTKMLAYFPERIQLAPDAQIRENTKTIALAESISTPVIASGGLASIEDIKAMLAPRAKKLAGAIAGRALYDGRLDPAAALALIRDARATAQELH